RGYGAVKLESDFLADVWVECEECQGRRFDRETLDIRYKGKSIADVFEMSVEEALQHFENQPKIKHILQTLHDVGLGYIQLGQPATTLSGGEAQRIKLAKELARPRTGGTLYILDEPTTGMHFEDVSHLLDVLHRFVDEGNSVIIVEHHPDVIKTADHIIDLGPEGGAEGGEVVASGTPEQVAEVEESATGQMLSEIFSRDRALELPSVYRKPHFQTDYVEVKGARQHNLRNIDARIPRRQMTAFSGVSGSGKTSLAIDTIYAEGQRRYVESLSPYARQFISQMEKPKVDNVRGLSPAVVIDNTNRGSTPRSTVGTVTEIYDYLRVLMSRLGRPHCPSCGAEVGAQSVEQIVDRILSTFQGRRLLICAPLHPDRSDDYATLLERAERDGWRRMRLDGEVHRLPYDDTIDRRRHHDVEIVVDRLAPRTENRSRLAEAVEASFGISGEDVIAVPEEGGEMTFSRLFACHECGESYEQITPRSFSFNNPDGWCRRCEGLGTERGVDPELLMPDDSKSIRNGGVKVWGEIEEGSLLEQMVEALAEYGGFSIDDPIGELTEKQRRLILYGDDEQVQAGPNLAFEYRGIVPTIEDAGSLSREFRKQSSQLLRDRPCGACGGDRVRPEAAAVQLRGHTIGEICNWSLAEAHEFFQNMELDAIERPRAQELLTEIRRRLKFLNDVGLDYLNLHRSAPTLSGGESQRVKLAAQLGADLTGVLYVLDEPTVGVHPRDNDRMLNALHSLRDEGNTVIVVEHDPQTLGEADHLMDFGPRAGRHGGEIVAKGTQAGLKRRTASVTGKVLSGELQIQVPDPRRTLPDEDGWLQILGARHNNLRDIDVHIPLQRLTVVTGPSGSGKSSLIGEILYPEMMFRLQPGAESADPGLHRDITGAEEIERVVNVDQSPIGQTPRSNPATYVGAYDEIRKLYSQLPLSRMRGYTPGRFSFNKSGGRCEACEGMGSRQVEMHFLPDVWVHCEECGGRRFNDETLEVEYKGHTIADVLDM
ncbi:MAG: excinuclease ABC subunit UvrA, partial [Armatimonadota bacterium]